MTNTLPGWITFPTLLLVAVIVAVRYRWFNATRLEVYLNRTLLLLLIQNILREGSVQAFLAEHGIASVTLTQQLSLVATMYAAASFMGFVEVWWLPNNLLYSHRNRHHYLIITVLAVAFLVAATPARRAGQTLESYDGWSVVVALILVYLYPILIGLLMLVLPLSEVRRRRLKRRDLAVIAAGVIIGGVTLLHPVQEVLLKILETRGVISDPSGFLTRFHGYNIVLLTGLAGALAAVPVIVSAAGWRGDDLTSRHWRALQPMRRDLARAVPDADIRVSAARSKTRMDLHLTDVAIRDAMLALRPWYREAEPQLWEHCHSVWSLVPGQHHYAEEALQLAAALAAREAGESPASAPADSPLEQNSPEDLEDDITEIVRVARWWGPAKAAVARDRKHRARAAAAGASES